MARRRDQAASLPRSSADVQDAAHIHRAAVSAGQQQDGAVAVLEGLRLQHTGVVDRVAQQVARHLRCHEHLAAIGLQQATVFQQGLGHALINRHVQQLIARQVQRHGVASRQSHAAELCHHHALVADLAAEQRHIAAVSGMDLAQVDNGTRTGAGKAIVT